MRHSRPLAAAAVLALSVPLASAGFAATADSSPAPAKGSAQSQFTLLTLGVAGHKVSLINANLLSSTLSGDPSALVTVTPITTDGTATGTRSVSQDDPSITIPAVSTPAALANVLRVSSPPLDASATTTDDSATSTLTSGSLGALSVLGIPIKAVGSLDLSSVVSPSGADATKQLVVHGLTLPSLGDLLAGLGLDTGKLPIDTLTGLLSQLGLGDLLGNLGSLSGVVDTATTTLDGLLSQLTSATSLLGDKQAAVTGATANLDSAVATVNGLLGSGLTGGTSGSLLDLLGGQSVLSGLLGSLGSTSGLSGLLGGLGGGTDLLGGLLGAHAQAHALTPTTGDLLGPLTGVLSGLSLPLSAAEILDPTNLAALGVLSGLPGLPGLSGLTAALTSVGSLQDLLTTVTGALAPVQNLVNTLTGGLGLLQQGLGLLDNTPLGSLGSLDISTIAATGSKHTADVTGTVAGLKLLGTDVLNSVLGSSSVDILGLADSKLTAINDALSGVLAPISSVLNGAVPGLKVPTPVVQLLRKTTSTDPIDGLQGAANSVSGLSLSWPALAIPSGLALPGAAGLLPLAKSGGALTPHATGVLPTGPLTLDVATMTDGAQFAPAGTAGSTDTTAGGPTGTTATGSATDTGSSTLPNTGAPALVAVVALILTGAGLLSRRLWGRVYGAGS